MHFIILLSKLHLTSSLFTCYRNYLKQEVLDEEGLDC